MSNGLKSSLLTPLVQLAAESRQQPFDAVVIGAGTAGVVAARTLVEGGARVAMLEAGPLLLLTHSNSTALRFEPEAARAVRESVSYSPLLGDGRRFGRLAGCVGGRSLFWNGAAPRYTPVDLAAWPIDPSSLDDAYDWAERDFRVTRDFGTARLTSEVIARFHGAGFPFAQAGPLAIDITPSVNGWVGGTIANAVASLLRSTLLARAKNVLKLSAQAFAHSLIFSKDRSRATGVNVVDRDSGNTFEVLGRSVVLAAGALESTRLALASSVPDSSGTMGRYISDHLFCRAYYLVPPDLYDAALPETAVVFVPAGGGNRFQIEAHLPGNRLFLNDVDTHWTPAQTNEYAAMVRSFGPVLSRPENHIALTGNEAPGGYTVHFTLSEQDLQLVVEMRGAMEKLRHALGAPALEPTLLDPGASFHEAGGLIMGKHRNASVTNEFGQFWQVLNLVSVDASTWPVVAAANPHLTIAAMSRRQSTWLAKDLRSGAA